MLDLRGFGGSAKVCLRATKFFQRCKSFLQSKLDTSMPFHMLLFQGHIVRHFQVFRE